MLGEVWKTLLDYLRRTPYWPVFEPVALIGFLYAGVCVIAYQYIEWRYKVTLDPSLFLQSYVFREVSVVFVAVVGTFCALVVGRGGATKTAFPAAPQASPGRRLLGRGVIVRILVVLFISSGAFAMLQRLAPESKVSPIRVRFAALGTFAPRSQDERAQQEYQRLRDVVQYVLYEINHRQRAWQLELETRTFRTDLVPKGDEERCTENDTPPLCIAEAFRETVLMAQPSYPPLVLVMAEPLGGGGTRAWFWLNRGPVSVITTSDWGGPASAGIVEFLAYALVVQSLTIHMQRHCALAQPPAGSAEGVVVGNVFDLQPGFDAMRSAVLSGHLSRNDELRLLNCFGPDYMRTAVSLLDLTWLRSSPVRDNLRKVYGIELLGA